MVATARPLRTAKHYCQMLDADALSVSNGARVICGNQRTEYGICQQSAIHLLNTLNRHPSLLITLETGDVAAATKWNGIKAMLDISNCSPEETAYFGDDHDDIEPIKMCGIGIAVSNGIDEVKTAADYVAQSNDEDGVARFIEQMLLRKL